MNNGAIATCFDSDHNHKASSCEARRWPLWMVALQPRVIRVRVSDWLWLRRHKPAEPWPSHEAITRLSRELFDIGLHSVGPDDLDNRQIAERLLARGIVQINPEKLG